MEETEYINTRNRRVIRAQRRPQDHTWNLGFILSKMESLEGFEQREDEIGYPLWLGGAWGLGSRPVSDGYYVAVVFVVTHHPSIGALAWWEGLVRMTLVRGAGSLETRSLNVTKVCPVTAVMMSLSTWLEDSPSSS